MATFYVNDLNRAPGGDRVNDGGIQVRRFNTGTDPTSGDPCQYAQTIDINETRILSQTTTGLCRMGGRAWVVRTLGTAVQDASVVPGVQVSASQSLNALPDNIKHIDLGNGFLAWAEDATGKAVALTFIPHPL